MDHQLDGRDVAAGLQQVPDRGYPYILVLVVIRSVKLGIARVVENRRLVENRVGQRHLVGLKSGAKHDRFEGRAGLSSGLHRAVPLA